jgi:hypothetical protein
VLPNKEQHMTFNPETPHDDAQQIAESLPLDMLWGVEAIATYIDRDVRPTYYQLQQGYLPGKKVGRIWTSSKSALRKHLTPTVAEPARLPDANAA